MERKILFFILLTSLSLAGCRSGAENNEKDRNGSKAAGEIAEAEKNDTGTGQARPEALPFASRGASRLGAVSDIAAPDGFTRIAPGGAFQKWLRKAPILSDGARAGKGGGKSGIEASATPRHASEAVIFLWAYYRFQTGNAGRLRFQADNGHWLSWNAFRRGNRYIPTDDGKRLVRIKGGRLEGRDYPEERAFRDFLRHACSYIGPKGLLDQFTPVAGNEAATGDFFAQPPSGWPGQPGQVSLVLDIARNAKGEKRFLIGAVDMGIGMKLETPGGSGGKWFTIEGFRKHAEKVGPGEWRRF